MNGRPNPTLVPDAGRHDAARRRNRRVLLPALVLSAVLHAMALVFLSFSADPERMTTRAAAPALIELEPVMRAVDLAVVTTEPAPVQTQLRERELPSRLTPAPEAWSPAQEAPARPADTDVDSGTSFRDRLQYRMGSTEVWRPQAPLPMEELSPDERVRARVASQLQEYNDSVAAEAAAGARATDWTVKDGKGGKWGVSPGSIHLGNVTLPLPFALSTPPGRREEVAGRLRSWTEIQEQASRVEGRQIFDERVRAIRERAEQERARTGSSTAAPPPAGGTSGGG
jgi:hypothetical protein